MRCGAFLLGAALVGGCGFSVTAGAVADAGDDEVPEGMLRTLTDDTVTDFAAGTGYEATIAVRGAIEPASYITGGLHAFGYDQEQLISSTTTFETLQAALPTPSGERYAVMPVDWSVSPGRPRGLGLTSSDDYTLVFDGEIQLPAGSVNVAVRGDDDAIMQISLDGGTSWGALAYDNVLTPDGVLALTVPAAGWYRIRVAVDENGGSASLRIRIGGADVTEAQLRARVSEARGLIANAFDSILFLDPLGESVVRALESDFGGNPPRYDLDIPNDQFVLRHTGQILIDTQGDYTFTVDVGVEEYYRVIVDRAVVAENYVGSTLPMTGTVALAPGWHDLTVDYTELSGDAHARLRVTGGAFTGPVASDHLRPVVAAGLVAPGYEAGPYQIADATSNAPAQTTRSVAISTPAAGTTIELVDWYFDLEGRGDNSFTDQQVTLDCPTSTDVPAVVDNGSTFFLSKTACAGMPLPTTSTFKFNDVTMGGNVVTARFLYAAFTYHGGATRQPFPRTATFVSSVKPMPGATAWGRVGIMSDARAATITLEVRAAADEASLETAAWAVVADGDVPQTPIGEVAQYRITIESDGWQLASVDRVDVRYLTP